MDGKVTNPFSEVAENIRLRQRGLEFEQLLPALPTILKDADRGKRTLAGSRKSRRRGSSLWDLVGRVYVELAASGRTPTEAEVWEALKAHLDGPVIQEMSDSKIRWVERRSGRGNTYTEHTTARGTFRNHLTRLRNRQGRTPSHG